MKIQETKLHHDLVIIRVEFKQFRVSLLNIGASIYRIEIKENDQFEDITLAHQDIDAYLTNKGYYGTTCGPIAGRIADAMVVIDNQQYELERNFLTHHLHGGSKGISFICFPYKIIQDKNVVKVIFTVLYDQRNAGLPGILNGEIIYTIGEAMLNIEYRLTPTENTMINFTNHSYYNLCGNYKETVLNHILKIPATKMLEMDNEMIPTSIVPISNIHDFRKGKIIGVDIASDTLQKHPAHGYDHCYILDEQQLSLNYKNRMLSIATNAESVVVYTHNYLNDTILLNGEKDFLNCGVALECQNAPNGINIDGANPSIVNKNQIYYHYMNMTFDF